MPTHQVQVLQSEQQVRHHLARVEARPNAEVPLGRSARQRRRRVDARRVRTRVAQSVDVVTLVVGERTLDVGVHTRGASAAVVMSHGTYRGNEI